MLNQTFTSENFRKIFDVQNRKGNYLEGKFFPGIETTTISLKDCSSKFRALRKNKASLSKEAYEVRREVLHEEKKILKESKEKLLNSELEKLAKQISEPQFRVKFKKVTVPNGKDLYVPEEDAASYFALQQLTTNIYKLFKVKQSHRYNILCQLRSVLDDSFSKCIVRTDISSFYESICRKKLLETIDVASLLTFSSKSMLRQILKDYGTLSGSTTGLPRGISISAYLAELYLRDFDRSIKNHPDVIFYARYVDDIVVVFGANPHKTVNDFYKFVEDNVVEKNLNLNLLKTQKIDTQANANYNFDYLGYRFDCSGNKISLKITQNKIDRYKKKIDLSFDSFNKLFNKKKKNNKKSTRNLLIKRLKFLTGNTKLWNNKSNAVVGIYFSNSLVTDSKNILALDQYLKYKINLLPCENTKSQLKSFSFVKGFSERTFYTYTPVEFAQIVKVWKNVT